MGIFHLVLFCLIFGSGSSIADRPPLEAIQKTEIQKSHMLYSDSIFTDQKDTIPVVNPTPIFNPPTPITTQPIITPTTPITTPVTTPITTPVTTPTTTPITTPITTPTTTPVTTPVSYGGSWCVASQTASDTALQVALDYACGYGGADCSGIQPGAGCYNPNTARDHASYAFNDYYQKNPIPTSCIFGGTAQLTSTDPSSGSCHYGSPRSTSIATPTIPTPVVTSPMIPNTPVIPYNTPMIPNTPTFDTPSIFGSEPTGTPSSATFSSHSRLLFITSGFLGLIIAAMYQ